MGMFNITHGSKSVKK